MINETRIKNYFTKRLVEYMNKKNLRPWYVAYYSEISETTFRKHLKGITLPKSTTLILMAELFECSVNDLLGYKRIVLPVHDGFFSSAIDTPKVANYFWHKMKLYLQESRISYISELAYRSFVTEYTIHKHIDNNTLPDTLLILRICDAPDCTPSDLLGY